MFSKAYNIANKFTHPFIIVLRTEDGHLEGGLGSFIVLNDEGWCMTAAHNFGVAFTFNQHQQERLAYEKQKSHLSEQAQQDSQTPSTQGMKNPKWLTHFAILLGGQSIPILQNFIYGEHDIAFFQIDPKGFSTQTVYPKIKSSTAITPGTSLCKLGFPFVEVNPTFDMHTATFGLSPQLLPIPLFPIEGIYTRNILRGMTQDGSMDILFIETSSPGLKGQSGGPIFDIEGNIYAVQSQNATLPLGFKGTVISNGIAVEENQFFNVGMGVHPATLEILLNKHHIKYAIAP
ncbi:MAG: trypsin-like peptidase domain-containing protein [Bacteroidetes bacterium]|nr:trypsin-like peptidase domain-containing protein [Bacteroidota bacterium]